MDGILNSENYFWDLSIWSASSIGFPPGVAVGEGDASAAALDSDPGLPPVIAVGGGPATRHSVTSIEQRRAKDCK